MASHLSVSSNAFHRIFVNGVSINDARFGQYIDPKGVFSYNGITIKPSGSVRFGDVKVHPSGLIQVGDKIHVEGSIVPVQLSAGKTPTSKISSTTTNQSKAREVLSESSNKANVQPKKSTQPAKDKQFTLDKHAAVDVQVAGNKRKPSETITESAKKQKTSATVGGNAAKVTGNVTASASTGPKSIYEIELDGQYLDDVPVYDSCDQIRSKIEARLLQPGVTKAQFCRDLTDQLYSSDAPAKIQSNMLDAFRKKRGPTSGCTSSVYYAGYVFFEKWRMVNNEAKSRHRLEMEKTWPGGVARDRDDSNRGVWCAAGERPRQDAYGRWKFN